MNKKKNDNWNGTIRERLDGRWEARIALDGIRKSFYGATESEALKKMRVYRNNPITGKGNKKTIILNDYIENYMSIYKLDVIKSSTYDRYENTYLHHISGTIGKRQIHSLTSDDIQKLINVKVNPQGASVPLSRSSVVKIIDLLSMVFKHALRQGVITRNPADGVVIPSSNNFKVKTKELYALDIEALVKIKKVADETRANGKPYYRYAYLYMILLNTGLRCGELLALTWDDVDFEKKQIIINKSVMVNVKERDNKGNAIKRENKVADTKTISGERTIPLNAQATFYLKCNLEYLERNNIESEFVAYAENGNRAIYRSLQRTLDLVLKRAEVPHCGLHVLRHTFGSVLLSKGVEISVVSYLMGHSSTKITYDKYIHVFEEQKIEALKMLNIT